MSYRHVFFWGCLALGSLVIVAVTGCSTSSGLAFSGDGDRVVTPPIHVNTTRAGVSYTPAQIRHAYGFDTITGTGAGQTIAIVDAYGSPTIQNDLNVFCTKFSIPSTTVTIATPNGMSKTTNSGWALETSLDVEWAHVIAPGATILLVEAASASTNNLIQCIDYAAQHASAVSMSWGSPEFSGESNYNSHFNVPKVSFFASSGDSGAQVCWPADSPYVVGVGGTTLKLDASNNITSETAWSGSGGGQSKYISRPAFQQGWQSSAYRQVPDVSLVADPNTGVQVYDSTKYSGQSGWWVVGGTSASAPQWAAAFALVNGSRTTPISTVNADLYGIGTPSTFTTYFNDIVSGSNGAYTAKTGYDMVTGLGSPKARTLIPALVAAP